VPTSTSTTIPGSVRAVLCLVVLATAGISAGCGSDEDTSAGTTAPAAATKPPAGSDSLPGGCAEVAFPEPRTGGNERRPAAELDTDTTYTLTFTTNCGDFTVTLDQKSAPATSASLVALARAGYFDDTLFHRIAPGFVIQGGDPTQTGGGGPGYQTVDAPPPDAAYTKGVVAMAKAPSEAPGTAGSQFFVVTTSDSGLPPEYAVVGRISDGLDVVETIGAHGDEFEQPTQPIVIERVTVAAGG
jgi:peptidyl-prolyl cis-trans isomerase B (cyclophilin B)